MNSSRVLQTLQVCSLKYYAKKKKKGARGKTRTMGIQARTHGKVDGRMQRNSFRGWDRRQVRMVEGGINALCVSLCERECECVSV